MRRKIDFSSGDFAFFRDGIGAIESDGNYNAINSLGFLGKYQFGEGLLVDLGYYSFEGDNSKGQNTWEGQWKQGLNSAWEFLGSPSVQDQAFNGAMQLRWNWVERKGLDEYVGTKINGITITEAGLLAAAWLYPKGLLDYLKSNGAQDYTEPGDSISQRLFRFSSGFNIPFANSNSPFLPSCINPDDWQILFTTATTLPPPQVGIPIVLDLDGDGVETTSVNDGAYFDHDTNGFAERTGWASLDDGLLAWDRNGDGIINDGKELFGDQTILQNGERATNGFQALAEWDENLDGKIDFMDSVWSQLRIWQDYDGDGRTNRKWEMGSEK